MALLADWRTEGLCRGTHAALFFPPLTFERKDIRVRREERAKAICTICPVLETCAAHALSLQEVFGIWGGMTERERRDRMTGDS